MTWTDNLLVSEARWGDRVRVGDWGLGTQTGFIIVTDVLWRGIIPTLLAYLPRIPPENARADAHHGLDARLWENHLKRAQNVLYAHHIGSDESVNQSDDDWNEL